MNKFISLIPAILIAAALFIASHQPNLSIPEFDFRFGDKLLHFFAYAVFGLTIGFALNYNLKETSGTKIFLILLLIGALYGFSDEYHQSFIPGRTADVFDWLADVIGIAVSWPLFIKLKRMKIFRIFFR